MKQIDIGGLSFAEIREKDKYYVDKTLLIKDILDSNAEGIYLFTRPRRFGKTTNLSMLDAFFSMKYKGNTWFDDLEISKYPEYKKYKNAFPVIHLNLKETKASGYSSFVNKIRLELSKVFTEFDYLRGTDVIPSNQVRILDKVQDLTIEEDFISGCVPMLCKLLERYHGVKPIILIDEYDRAVSDAFGSESHRPMMDFLGEFLSAMLKNNEHLQMAVVTGIMQIAKESIFSGLNNLRVNNIFSEMSDERYGFTESEVKQILSDYGHPEKFDEVKEWYDGYRFGNAEVYNPFSVMYFVSNGFKSASYWVDSGKDAPIRWLLDKIDDKNLVTISSLVTGGTVRVTMDEALTYGDVCQDIESLYSVMAMSGYLKAAKVGDMEYDISIPNKEVGLIVERFVRKLNPIDTQYFTNFVDSVANKDVQGITESLQNILLQGDYMMLDHSSYQAIIMTLLYSVRSRYDVRAEDHRGNGSSDIIMAPKDDAVPIIFELKVVRKESDLDRGVDDAIAQIHERRYYNGLKGTVVLVGISFWGKAVNARIDTIDNGDGFSYKHE